MENVTNPLMAKIKLPGRTFQLPSRGALYKNGELTGSEGEIHVHPMSALAEISLKNPDMLFNGTALNQVFGECIPEIKKPTELYARDIDAIMFFLRLVTYGPDFEVRVKHDCAESKIESPEGKVDHKEHSYVVNIEEMINKINFLDPTTAPEQFKATVGEGENMQIVMVHPIKFQHMIELFHMNTGKAEFTDDDIKKNVVFNLVNLIESVDGITDKKMIEEWVKGITTPFQNRVLDAIDRASKWGPDQTAVLHCKDCKKEMPVDLPLNPISFFTE